MWGSGTRVPPMWLESDSELDAAIDVCGLSFSVPHSAFLRQDCHRQGQIFQGQGKVGEFLNKSGKFFDIFKVDEISGKFF